MPAASVKIMKRSLPSRHNPMLEGSNIPPCTSPKISPLRPGALPSSRRHHNDQSSSTAADPSTDNELVEMRRLGQTNLGSKSPNDTNLFSYVHLRAPLPQPLEGSEIFGNAAPESYFLMRRSQDGFVSSTGMFKASFPWAKKREEDLERQYVREHFAQTSNEETAGNLWVHPTDALALADDYGMRVWIEALLDNEAVMPSDHRKRNITPPPLYFKPAESDAGSVASSTAPPTAARRRSTRSASPSKRLGTSTPRKTRGSKAAAAKDSPLKKAVAPITEDDEESVTLTTTETTALTTTESIPVLTNGDVTSTHTSMTTPVKGEPSARVEVDEEIQVNGDVEIRTTHVKVELPAGQGDLPIPESTEDMISKAREMVAEARRLEDPEASAAGKKRKAEDIATAENEAEDDPEAEVDDESRHCKRSRVVIEEELKREKVKNKALIGLSAVLAIGALFPYVL